MQLYDGVTIPPDGKFPSMTGVIVYKKDDTIGVRLTGESEGMGDHSGSVDGVDYFDGGVNSGILTTVGKVELRKLTFAEEGLIRSLLQPKPAFSASMASSVPMSGLSPAALARMRQLNQRMGVPTASTTPTNRNMLPPSASAPDPATPPQLSDPPMTTATTKTDSPSGEPPLAEEKKLSRLEILRQKKEAIRKRKLELEKKVVESKKEKLQQQQEEEAQEETKPQEPMETEESLKPPASPKSSSSPPPIVVRNSSTTDTSMADEVASVRSKESSSMLSKASRSSRDSIEQLWIHELRNESPESAGKYDLEDAENLVLEEDEHEMEGAPESTQSLHVDGIPKQQQQPALQLDSAKKEGQGADGDGRLAPMRQSSLSRLQQLRQKKRLLEALPASIQTPASTVGKDVVVETAPQNNLASMAMASAAALGHANDHAANFPDRTIVHSDDDDDDDDDDEGDSKTTASHMEVGMDDGNGDDDAVPAAFQESVTITSGTANPLPADVVAEPTPPKSSSSNTNKRRRILGLGFLPGINRQQKRQNTGQGKQQ
ncbi:MAG: hypothetical protein SGBAC_013516 [Bacillariaceae sp.]